MKLDLIVYMAIIVVVASGSALLLFSLVASKVSIRNRKTNYRTDQNDHLLNHHSMFAKPLKDPLENLDINTSHNKFRNYSESKISTDNSSNNQTSKRMQIITLNK